MYLLHGRWSGDILVVAHYKHDVDVVGGRLVVPVATRSRCVAIADADIGIDEHEVSVGADLLCSMTLKKIFRVMVERAASILGSHSPARFPAGVL